MKVKLFLLFLLLIFTACSTTPPTVVKSFATETGLMYFIPSTDWETRSKDMDKAKLDITYHTGSDLPPAVNISFFGKKETPRKVTSISLNGEGIVYPLSNIRALYADSKKRILRITSDGERNSLASLLEADTITLTAEIDGASYTYTPGKMFNKLKTDFLIMTSY